MRFAPLSAAPSARLRFAVWFFRASAVLVALRLLIWLIAYPFGWHIRVPLFWPITLNVTISGAAIALNLWIANALSSRRMVGFWIAIVMVGLALVATVRRGSLLTLSAAWAMALVLVVASVWGELQQPGPPPNAG
jgi:hypothetical protein